MRKLQRELLQRAEKGNMGLSQMAFLSREDMTLQELQAAMDYFRYQPQTMDQEALAAEAEKCIFYLKRNRGHIAGAHDYYRLLAAFLPSHFYMGDTDVLAGSGKKLRILKCTNFCRTIRKMKKRL